jgi:hypothetical protein
VATPAVLIWSYRRLSALVVGDAVTFNVDSTNPHDVDKLHIATESLNQPQQGPGSGTAAEIGSLTGSDPAATSVQPVNDRCRPAA